ncbi:hypothetical protein L2750_13760 [Shewanella submarina]|uniref:Rod shape-determining protein MreB n=1 Tax=Shewanella submarina TaxID=2016376 RepID=A0ABV7GE63_9GAMM|nr:hypothetical protein [Shewanella submarina]MCL1038212.1 hypothetical protein [Shewanella submarina]
MFNSQNIYYQIRRDGIKAVNIETGMSAVRACPALSHPRSLMGDFVKVEACIKEVTKEVTARLLFQLAPVGIAHLMEMGEGGYTNVEIRAFREAFMGAGMRQVHFPSGQSELSTEAIKSKSFEEHKGI